MLLTAINPMDADLKEDYWTRDKCSCCCCCCCCFGGCDVEMRTAGRYVGAEGFSPAVVGRWAPASLSLPAKQPLKGNRSPTSLSGMSGSVLKCGLHFPRLLSGTGDSASAPSHSREHVDSPSQGFTANREQEILPTLVLCRGSLHCCSSGQQKDVFLLFPSSRRKPGRHC